MIRKIIHIDEEKCNGCGLCANACHEGAIEMVNGKAKLVRENFCDGFGDCLPGCPTGAIRFEEREAPAYDEAAVQAAKAQQHACPGAAIRQLNQKAVPAVADTAAPQESMLCNWPVQIKLAPLTAPYFEGADLLIAADCTAYAYAAFHHDFIRGRITLIGCPKLDSIDYSEKLTAIIRNNRIAGVTVVRMEVPCCGGLELAVKKALHASGKALPWKTVIIGMDGTIKK